MFMDWKTQYCKTVILHKLINKSHAIPVKISLDFLMEIHKLILILYENAKRPKIAKTIFKKDKVGRLILPFRLPIKPQ